MDKYTFYIELYDKQEKSLGRQEAKGLTQQKINAIREAKRAGNSFSESTIVIT